MNDRNLNGIGPAADRKTDRGISMNHAVGAVRRGGLAVALALASALAPSADAATLWQNDWETTEPWPVPYTGLVRATSSGEAVAFERRDSDNVAWRLRADGSLRWIGNSSPIGGGMVVDGVAFDDGSAAQLQRNSRRGYLTRFDTNGMPLWGRPIPAGRFAAAGTAFAGVGCHAPAVVASSLDQTTGATRWQRVLRNDAQPCTTVAVTGSTNGDAYFAYRAGTPASTTVTRLTSSGSSVWSVNAGFTGTSIMLAVNGAHLFALSGPTIWAFRVSDGGLAWQGPCANANLQFVDTDPVCAVSATEVKRLSAASGATVWARAASGGDVIGAFEGNVYYATSSQWMRLRGIDGVQQWLAPLASTLIVQFASAWRSASGVATIWAMANRTADHGMQRYRLSDGAVLGPVSPTTIASGMSPDGIVWGGSDLFVRGRTTKSTPSERLRRMAVDTGQIAWERSTARDDRYPTLALGPSALFVADRADGSTTLRALDRSTGLDLWSQYLASSSGDWFAHDPPTLVPRGDGDVIALNATLTPHEGPFNQQREYVQSWRFAANDGAVRWERLLVDRYYPDDGAYIRPPATTAVGDDVVIAPNARAGLPAPNLQRLSSASGAPLWQSPEPAPADLLAAAVDEDAIFSVYGDPQAGAVIVTKRAASTGQILWRYSHALANGERFRMRRLVPLAGGDVMLAANVETGIPYSVSAPRLLRIRGDGSGLRYVWGHGIDPAMPIDMLADFAVDASGRGWLHRYQTDFYLGAAFLVRFDLDNGYPIGGQFYRPSGLTPLAPHSVWDFVVRPYRDDTMITVGTTERAPMLSTLRVALRDYAVQQHGDLSVQIDSLPASFAPATQVPLGVSVRYDGDAALSGVTLVVDPPWHGTHSGLACSGAGQTHCTIDVRDGQITVRFNALPGAHLRLTGFLRALEWPTAAAATPRAVVFAPESLLESDTRNNFHAAGAIDRIFRDGFATP